MGLFNRSTAEPKPDPADALEFRFVTTDRDVERRYLVDDYGLVYAAADLEAKALQSLEEKARKLGANSVVGLRFGYDRGQVTAYGTARRYHS